MPPFTPQRHGVLLVVKSFLPVPAPRGGFWLPASVCGAGAARFMSFRTVVLPTTAHANVWFSFPSWHTCHAILSGVTKTALRWRVRTAFGQFTSPYDVGGLPLLTFQLLRTQRLPMSFPTWIFGSLRLIWDNVVGPIPNVCENCLFKHFRRVILKTFLQFSIHRVFVVVAGAGGGGDGRAFRGEQVAARRTPQQNTTGSGDMVIDIIVPTLPFVIDTIEPHLRATCVNTFLP